MKIRLLRNLFYKNKIRSVKAYNKILQNGELDKVDAIKEKLLDRPLFKINKKLNNIFILGSDFDIDLSIRQYLYTHLIHININEALFKSLAFNDKIIFPLPLVWIKILEKDKINVSKFFCTTLWFFFVIKFFLYAQLSALKEVIKFFYLKNNSKKNSFYFSNFPFNDLSDSNKASKFLSIFKNKFGNKDCENFYHDNRHLPQKFNLPNNINLIKRNDFTQIYSFKTLAKFFIAWPFFSLVSLLLVFFNWTYIILLKEILVKFIFIHDKQNQYSHYFFSNSSSLFRPIWTYFIHYKKSNYFFYFYSIASLPIKVNQLVDKNEFYKYFRSNYYGLKYISWKNFLFWNDFQKNFYFNTILENKGLNYDYIEPFCDFGKDIKILSKKKILAVFDISPFRPSYYAKRNAPLMTHEKKIIRFYDDLMNLKIKHNLHLIIKTKRLKFSNVISKKYISYVNKLSKIEDVTLLDESFSVESIINNCDLVVSSPFTTPAYTAKLLKKNSVYYDLSPCKYRISLAYNDIFIIKDLSQLSSWIKNNI